MAMTSSTKRLPLVSTTQTSSDTLHRNDSGADSRSAPSEAAYRRELPLLCLALLVILLALRPATAGAESSISCEEIGIHQFKSVLTVISGSCPEINLAHRHIPGSLKFSGLNRPLHLDLRNTFIDGSITITDSALDTVDMTDSTVAGSVTIIGVVLNTLLLTGAHVTGEVNIAERSGVYDYIDNQSLESCVCQRKFGRTQFQMVNANALTARSFTMSGVGAEELRMISAKFSGSVILRQAWFGDFVSFQYLQALSLSINSVVISGTLQAAQSNLEYNFNLECSTVGEELIFWWARFGGHLQLDGTWFKGTKNVWGFGSEMKQLTLGAAEGSIQLFRLERSRINVLRLTEDKNCLRGPTINLLRTAGMTFDWMEGDLDMRYANYFFAKGQYEDPTLYGRLAKAYSARGQHDEADKALSHQRPFLGFVRTHASSSWGLAFILTLWLGPVAVWWARQWPKKKKARMSDRAMLGLDLLLPDLVALGARERYAEDLKNLSGLWLFLLGVYRLMGWFVISVIVYVIVERGSY
jgi:hypothetical protein